MPRLSAFTRFGHLRFSSRKTVAEQIYRDAISNQGGERNFAADFGSLNSTRVYCNSMAAARARLNLERAGNQVLPSKAVELLPALEDELGVIPTPTDTIKDRQNSVSAAALISRGARKENLDDILKRIAGDNFIKLIPTKDLYFQLVRPNPETYGNWVAPGTPGIVGKIIEPITRDLGSPQTVHYTLLAGDTLTGLKPGVRMLLDTMDFVRAEAVTIESATSTTFVATFNQPHEPGTAFNTGRAPNMTNMNRHSLVLVAPGTSADVIRKMHRALTKAMRGISTWSIGYANSDKTTAGPFKVGVGLLGLTPIGEITL